MRKHCLKNLFLAGFIAFLGTSLSQAAETDKKEYDHLDLVLIIDKSGSMHGLESDTIGGFNSMLDKQREQDINTDVTTVMFNSQHEIVHSRKNISEVKALTEKEYRAGGTTALLDSVGNTIDTVGSYKDVDSKNNKVVVAIITDGKENASREYSKDVVKKLIEKKQEEGWEFVFLGANIDAVTEAGKLGISSKHAVRYENSARGVQSNYNAISSFAAEAVDSSAEEGAWRKEVVEDKK